jgi:hypothetical protein
LLDDVSLLNEMLKYPPVIFPSIKKSRKRKKESRKVLSNSDFLIASARMTLQVYNYREGNNYHGIVKGFSTFTFRLLAILHERKVLDIFLLRIF